jgi:hypothetical protein
VSSTASAEFTLTNSTTSAINVNCGAFSFSPFVRSPASGGYHFRGGTCCGTTGLQLAPGNACTVVVEFAPPLVGQYDAMFSFQNSIPPFAWSNSVRLTGQGR